MGLLDFLKLKSIKASSAGMVSLKDGREAMEQAGLQFSGKAGLCYRASATCKDTISKAVRYPRSMGITGMCRAADDSYGCTWILLEDDQVERAVTSAMAAFDTFEASGCEPEFLCAVFAYEMDSQKVYWIYNRHGKFYPFVPVSDDRDNELELSLKRQLKETMPLENVLSQWYPLWGMPL